PVPPLRRWGRAFVVLPRSPELTTCALQSPAVASMFARLSRMTNKTATATLHTNRGDIAIELFGNHAPATVANFVGLADGYKEYSTENASGEKSGPFYDGAVF